MIWALCKSGAFTLESAWQLMRQRGTIHIPTARIWTKHIPLKISIFLWWLIHNSISTDSSVRRKGITLVSKCLCCSLSPQVKTSTHLLLFSEVAELVWNKLHGLMELPKSYANISQLLHLWWHTSSVSNLYQWLKLILPYIALWMISKARNAARFQDRPMKGDEVLKDIKHLVSDLSITGNLSLPRGSLSSESLVFFICLR